MVVTSMAGYQAAKVSADTDYSTLTYTQVGESDYSVASANDEFPFQLLEDQGTQMLIIPQVAAGTKPIWPDFTNVTLNGETFNQPAGAGIYIPYSSLNQEYNVFEATSAVDNHTFQIIIKKATTSGGGDDPAPTPSTLKWSELYTVNDDAEKVDTSTAVSYTHLTLPTIYSV